MRLLVTGRCSFLLALLCSATLSATASSVHATTATASRYTEYEAPALAPDRVYTVTYTVRESNPFDFAEVAYSAPTPRTYSVPAEALGSVAIELFPLRAPRPPKMAYAIRPGWRGYTMAVAYRPVMSEKLYSQLTGRTVRHRELVKWATGQYC